MYNPGRRGLVRLCRRSSAHHLATMQRKRLRASECPSWAPGSRAVLRASVSPLTVTCPRNRQLSQLLNLLPRDPYVACQNRLARATIDHSPYIHRPSGLRKSPYPQRSPPTTRARTVPCAERSRYDIRDLAPTEILGSMSRLPNRNPETSQLLYRARFFV